MTNLEQAQIRLEEIMADELVHELPDTSEKVLEEMLDRVQEEFTLTNDEQMMLEFK